MSDDNKKGAREEGVEDLGAGEGQDKGQDDGDGREPRPRRARRGKVSFLTINKIDSLDYKDVPLLKRFLTERGKILPRRQTGNTAKQQRMVAQAVKRAREMALIPFVVSDPSDDSLRRPPREPREPRDQDS